MAHGVCPWWLGWVLANPLRRLQHKPEVLLRPYVQPGMTVLEPGPGPGFFTLELARMVGPGGRVIAADVQAGMLRALRRRATRAGLADRIDARLVPANDMRLDDVADKVDFVLAFAVVHEMPGAAAMFAQAARALRRGGTLLLAEPSGHVDAATFSDELQAAAQAGLTVVDAPEIRGTRAALLRRS